MSCTKINCPINAFALNQNYCCDGENKACPWRTEKKPGVIIIKVPFVLSEETSRKLYNDLMEQVKNGLLLLPNDYEVIKYD